jgi:hypothetical protein
MPAPLRSLRPLLALALLLSLSALPAGAETDEAEASDDVCYQTLEDGPEYCTSQVWFTPAETKVGNLGATGATGFPTWDDTEPTDSVTSGAGGGYLANGTFRQLEGTTDPEYVATFVGAHTGPLDNIDIELYLFAPGAQQEPTFLASGDLLIDGVRVATFDSMDLPLSSGGDAVLKTGVAFTDIATAMARRGIDPDGEHELQVSFTGFAIASTTAVFVYDTSEVPSGMVFNTADEEALRYPAMRAR